MGNDEKEHLEHAMSHQNEVTQCRTCCIPVNKEETEDHLKRIHACNYRHIKFSIDNSLIELRIAAGKSYSNFWGIRLSSTDSTLNSFSSNSARWWQNFKNGRSLGTFRILNSKFSWKCPMCEGKSAVNFNETISMRTYALTHLEHHHFEEVMVSVPGFFEFEWYHLNEETDFDVRALMHIRQQRIMCKGRSYLTFYTINLSKMENGENFLTKLKKRSGMEKEEVRYCLVCCCLVSSETIKQHFRLSSHSCLDPIASSSSFTHVQPDPKEVANEAGENVNNAENPEEEEVYTFEFPKELFLYSNVFKNLRKDEFKWRCCLCPRAHAHIFTTQLIMRMYALRHIDQHHKYLFTEEFMNYEWLSAKHEIRASFDIRTFTPLQYTIKGESTFNATDPNDYTLPQQYFFIPKDFINETVICGFCYRSFNKIDFLLHIVLHGFRVVTRETAKLRPASYTETANELMGQNNYSDGGLDDEPHNILSVDGKRLKSKMDLLAKRSYLNVPRFSEVTTPGKSERDTDGEIYTPSGRRSAMNARKLLTETFKVLQDNFRNRKDTWNESSCSSSSSSDESNSEDDRFERNLLLEATTKDERRERSKSTELKVKDLSKMRPAEVREWVKREAEKRGVDWKDQSSSSEGEDMESETTTERIAGNNWNNMRLKDIKELVRTAAKRKKIDISNDSSSDSDDC